MTSTDNKRKTTTTMIIFEESAELLFAITETRKKK
jgi:hypothetical protein